VEIKFFNPYTMQVVQSYNNALLVRMLFLAMLKGVFGYSVQGRYRNLRYIMNDKEAIDPTIFPIMEILYYKDGRTSRYFSKNTHDVDVIEKALRQNLRGIKNRFLHASLNDTVTITKFMNDHILSFTKENGINVIELLGLFAFKNDVSYIPEGNVYCKLIEDDTLNELTFYGLQVVELIDT
jgi:hypothetical protein